MGARTRLPRYESHCVGGESGRQFQAPGIRNGVEDEAKPVMVAAHELNTFERPLSKRSDTSQGLIRGPAILSERVALYLAAIRPLDGAHQWSPPIRVTIVPPKTEACPPLFSSRHKALLAKGGRSRGCPTGLGAGEWPPVRPF